MISLALSPDPPAVLAEKSAGQLAESGAHVVMAVRNVKAAQELIQKWQEEWTGRGLPLNIEAMELDLLSLDSVVRFAYAWNARLGPLYALINNAGIFSIGEPQKNSKDGHEERMQVNHLAPALLSVFLLPSLIRGSPSRTVNVNSVIMFSSVLQKRLPAESGINVLCVSPGIVHTNVARDLSKIVQASYHLTPYFIFSLQEGLRSTLFSATDPQIPEYCDYLRADDWPICAFIS